MKDRQTEIGELIALAQTHDRIARKIRKAERYGDSHSYAFNYSFYRKVAFGARNYARTIENRTIE